MPVAIRRPAGETYSVGKGNFTRQGVAKHRLRTGQTTFQVGIAFADTAGVDRAEETMATVSESPAKAVKEYLEPVRAAVEENIREVRRAVVAGRHAVEDCAADATIQVRRHPFMSLGVAVCVGTLFGCVIGFGVGRFGTRRPG